MDSHIGEAMRIFLIGLVLVAFALSCAAIAEKDYAQAGRFNISFDINKTHEIVKEADGENQTITLKTFDGRAEISILKISSGAAKDVVDAVSHSWGETIHDDVRVDGQDGKIGLLGTLEYKPFYVIIYPVDLYHQATILSTMPFLDTAHLLETIHIEKIK